MPLNVAATIDHRRRGLFVPNSSEVALKFLNGRCAAVRPSHGFAFGNVGEVKDACASYSLKIRVIHEPSKTNPNPAYTAIRNYKSDDIELLQLLASDAWSEVVEAKGYL